MPSDKIIKLTGSMAVLGPEGAGKRSVFEQLGTIIPKQWPPHIREPLRYKVHSNDYPYLSRYVFSIYSNVSELTLDLPERKGLLVLSLAHLDEFTKPDALKQYFFFFEFLQKLVWLGVDHYVLLVTHMDLLPTASITWFNKTIKCLKQVLETIFELTINECVPVARESGSYIDNLFDTKSDGILSWNRGPALVEALNTMVSKGKQTGVGLWVLGEIEHKSEPEESQWTTIHHARGEIGKKTQAMVYPHGLECIITADNKIISTDSQSIKPTKVDGSHKKKSLVLVSSDTSAKERAIIEVHALLKSQITPYELHHENRSYTFTFFGPQNKEGEVDRSTPSRISSISPEIFPESLLTNNQETIRQALGEEAHLRISCRRMGAVAGIFRDDQDAGRVLIWDDRSDEVPILIGVGRITGFPDIEIQDFVAKLMHFDQFRLREDSQSKMLSFLLEKIYHDSKHFAETPASKIDLYLIKTTQNAVEEDFQKILDKTLFIEKRIKEGKLPSELGSLHPHLYKARKVLSKQYQQLATLFKAQGSDKLIEQGLKALREEYARNTELIRKQTVFPLWTCVRDAERKLTKEMKTNVTIHNRLTKDWSYYPQKPSVLEHIVEALCQLFDNSRRHVASDDNINIHVFIDPPTVKSPDRVLIQYQDNGILTEEILRKIKDSESGIRAVQQKLSFDGAELEISPHTGDGIAFILYIPIWIQRLSKLENLSKDLSEILSAVDFEKLKTESVFPDFLGQLDAILLNRNAGSLQEKLKVLLTDAERASGSFRRWFDHNRPFLSCPLQPASYNELQEIRQSICHLRDKPTVSAVREAVSQVKTAFPIHQIRIKRLSNDFPSHRIESARIYYCLRDTIAWGLSDLILPEISARKRSGLLFDFQFSQHDQGDEVCISLYVPKIKDLSRVLLPLRTRLLLLGAATTFTPGSEDTVVLRVPVQKLKVKEYKKWQRF